MSNSWHKTATDEEAERHTSEFWSQHRNAINSGEFWADRIKELRGEPVKRLQLALDNLPLPASFREAAIAIRALIREKRKIPISYEKELSLLYWLAAINSFSIPYSKVLQVPGYNVIESTPGKKLKSLPFTYQELGFEKLELLNKTDVKWLIEAWGNPVSHTTLHEIHIDLWHQYEKKLGIKYKKQDQDFANELKRPNSSTNKKTSSKNNKMLLLWFVVSIVIVVFFMFGRG